MSSSENSPARFPLIPLDNPHLPPVGEDLQACADRMNRSIEYILRRCLYGGGGFQAEFSVNKAGDKKLMQVVAGHLWYADPSWRTRGPEAADIMVIGKCLNDADLEAQRIYAGDMGGVLLEGLRAAGWKDSEIGQIYLTTVLKTAPLDYSKSSVPQLWVKSQIHLLWQEILLVRPKLVLLQGAEAVKAVLGNRMTLRQLEADGLNMEVDFTGSPARGGPAPGIQNVQFLASVSPGAVLHDRRNPHSDQKYRTHVEQRMHRQLRDLHSRYTGKDTEVEQTIQTEIISNLEDLRAALEKMRQGVGEDKLVAWDAEWQGAHPQNPGAYLRCVQFAYREDHGVVIDLTHPGGKPRFTRTVEVNGEKVQTTEGAARAAMELCKQYMQGLRVAGHYFVADLEWLVPAGLDLREEYDAAPTPEEVHENKGGVAIELMAHAWDETAIFSLDEQIQAHLDIPLYFHVLHDYVKKSKLEAVEMGKVHDAERHEALKVLRSAKKRAEGKRTHYRDRNTGEMVCAATALREAEIAYGNAQLACQEARERSQARVAELNDGYGWMSDEVLYTYGAWDAVAELKLARVYASRIRSDRHGNDCTKAYWISHRAALAVLEINTTGFLVDRERVDHFAEVFTEKRDELLAQIREAFKWPDLNPRSRFEFAELLFGEQYNGYLQQYGKAKRTRPPGARTLRAVPLRTTGRYPMEWEEAIAKQGTACSPNTDKQTLGEMFYAGERLRVVRNVEGSWRIVNQDCSEEIGILRDFRFIDQALKSLIRPPVTDSHNNVVQDEDGWNDYDSGIISMICGDGRVRTRIRQTVETGRWASFDPNLTNLSKSREKDYRRLLGKAFRNSLRTVFTVPPGWFIVEADYTGAELLMAAIMSGDKAMIEHCQRNALPEDHPDHYDIHSNLTVRAFRLDCEPTKEGLASVGSLSLRTVAKCVIGDTWLQTRNGWRRVADLAEGLGPHDSVRWQGEPVSLCSHGEDTPLVAVHRNGRKRCITVRTETGYELTGSRDHQFLTVGSDGKLVCRKARDLAIGDWVCVRLGEGGFGSDVSFPQIEVPRLTRYKHLELPDVFDEDWAAWVGLYLAEGSCVEDNVIVVLASERDSSLSDASVALWARLFGDRARVHKIPMEKYQDQVSTTVSSVRLATWIREYLPGRQCERRIPKFAFSWPKPLQAAMLRWMFEGDGSIKKSGKGFTVKYSTCSEQLAKDVQVLLSGFGILSSRSYETRKGYDNKYWEVRVLGNASRTAFCEQIGFVTDADKGTAVNLSRYTRDNAVVPGQTKWLRTVYGYLRGKARDKCYECLRTKSAPVQLNSTRLKLILDDLEGRNLPPEVEEARQHLADIAEAKIAFYRVASLEDAGMHQVYDVETTSDEGHIVNYNGILTHQSLVFGRLYGRGVRAIAVSVRQEGVYITEQEAQALADAFMDQYPRLGPFLEECTQRPRIGWMCNLFGRYRRFPYTDDENKLKAFGREATNSPMQGGVADAVSIAARNLYDYRNERQMQYRLLLQVHDALMLLVPASELEEVIRRDGGVLTTCMVDNLPLYPTDLNGKRLPDVPEDGYRFGIGIEVNRRWGEEPDPGYLLEHGVDPQLLGWEPNGPDEWQQIHGGHTTTWSVSQNQFI